MTSDRFSQRILRFVSEKGYQPQSPRRLARAMSIDPEQMEEFDAACKSLVESGRVTSGAGDAIHLPRPPGKVTGIFRGNPRGYGFVVPEDRSAHGDIYVASEATAGAMSGDLVSVRVMKRGKRGGQMLFEGRILEVLRRGQSRFVGEIVRTGGRWFVHPDGNVLQSSILIPDASSKDVSPGTQVVVEITDYPTERSGARGVIVKVLGSAGEPNVDTLSIIEQYELPQEFPDAVLSEARRITEEFSLSDAIADREDLSGLTIITIDPEDAKDFDDAISLEEVDENLWELGVHIADVSHFVKAGSALDEEARLRANSVYLPGTVLPMLPELLSNGLCSLQERQPRLTKSVFISFDSDAVVRKARFAHSIIRSTKRLSYQQAQAILDGTAGKTSAKVAALVRRMDALARRIRARRLKGGMLELDLPEVDIIRDAEGRVSDARPADASFTHKIIEMFMVEANEAIARGLTELGTPFLRRTHGAPKNLADGGLRSFLRVLGHRLPMNADRFDLQKLLEEVQGHDDGFAVHLAVLKSMQAAEYSPELIGHYALASEHYGHFTSPIRRYADLTVHRLFDRLVTPPKRSKDDSDAEQMTHLAALGAHCVTQERRAEDAERELTLVLILRLLEQHLGEEFDGVVTGISNMGMFVQLARFQVDGLLRFDTLPPDHWRVDPSRACVVGERTRTTIKVGHRLSVRIAAVDIPRRRLDLAPSEAGPRARRSKGLRETDQSRSGTNRRRLADARSEDFTPRRGPKQRNQRRGKTRRR